jgi:cytochrome c
MKSIAIAAAAAFLAVCGIEANASEALAKSSGCFACHTVDKKLVGPSYRDIANKYRTDKKAAEYLAKKVKEGGKGVWGDIPMTANAHVKDADIQAIVAWILTVK